MKNKLRNRLFANFVKLNKEANDSYKNIKNRTKGFETASLNERRHFSQNKAPKV